jgi:predicted metallopeptidase
MGELQTAEPSFGLSIGDREIRQPLALRWHRRDWPLPVQAVRGHGRWERDRDYAIAVTPFDFSAHIRRLSEDVVSRCPDLAHVRTDEVLFGFTQARNGRSHGLQARVTPMRFRDGRLIRRYRGTPYQVQRFFVDGREIMYLMAFCLPRFLNQSFDDKLVTLFHELFHISPAFDGDLRRHGGRYSVHSHSQKRYDEQMATHARAYLATDPDPALHAFLRLSFTELRRQHGAVVAVTVPRPKLVPLPSALF